MSPSKFAATVSFLAALAGGARAEPILEGVAVRNRLYRMQSKFELAPTVGFGLAPQLTRHVHVALGAAYNFSETWALELRAGYSFSGHSATADEIGRNFLELDPAHRLRSTDDLSALWEMKANGLVGVRWTPLYGKLSIFSEWPLHFQAYLWAGGGAAQLHRQSIVYCRQVASREAGACADWLTENATRATGSAALGLRFFTSQRGSLRFELRDYIFRDSFLTSIDRVLAESGQTTGRPASSPGIVHLPSLELGYTFIL
jgi:outer membrane beta-barrel protein